MFSLFPPSAGKSKSCLEPEDGEDLLPVPIAMCFIGNAVGWKTPFPGEG